MARKIFEIICPDINEALELADEQLELLKQNVKTAVAKTTLYGLTRIANDCPVNTGRARASLIGDFASLAGIVLEGDPQVIAEGRKQSLTRINPMEGTIGSNVEYILYIEYGHSTTKKVKLTRKQLAYLFAKGILVKGPGGKVMPGNVHVRINRRAGIGGRVKGKGFFRKNLPLIERYFGQEMEEAIKATKDGRLLRKGD